MCSDIEPMLLWRVVYWGTFGLWSGTWKAKFQLFAEKDWWLCSLIESIHSASCFSPVYKWLFEVKGEVPTQRLVYIAATPLSHEDRYLRRFFFFLVHSTWNFLYISSYYKQTICPGVGWFAKQSLIFCFVALCICFINICTSLIELSKSEQKTIK